MESDADYPSSTRSPRSARAKPIPSSPGEHEAPPPSAAQIAPPELSDRSPTKSVENVASSSESPENGGDGNTATAAAALARGKKPVWNVPSNGSIEAGPFVEAISWPTPSESARASPKSSSSDSLKALSNGPVSAPQGPTTSSPSSKLTSSPSPKPTSSPSPKPSTTNLNPNPPSTLTRQKSVKSIRGGASSSAKLPNGGPAPPSPLPAQAEMPEVTPDKQAPPEPSPKGLPNNSTHISSSNLDNGGRGSGFLPQPHGGNDHHRSYSGNRRGSISGSGPHHNYTNRRDQERGHYEWNHRNFSGRDAHMQQLPQHRGVGPYLRPPPPVSAPFILPPPPGRPFGSPMGYPDMSSPVYYVATHPPPESVRGVPFVAHSVPPAMFFPTLDPQRDLLLKQIEYYFSIENLCKDTYLRNNMDGQGWVPISLIAGFKKVKQLTNNMQYILDTMQLSTIVEVQGGRIRRRNDWMKWLIPPTPNYLGGTSSPQPLGSPSYDTLAARMQTVGLEEATDQNSMTIRTETAVTRSASGILNNQHHVVGDLNGDGSGQVTGRTGSDRLQHARSLSRSDTL